MFINLLQLKKMYIEKLSVSLILLVMASLTTSEAMDVIWRNYMINPSRVTTEDPARNFLNVPFNMDNEKDVHTTEDPTAKIAVIPVSFSDPKDEIALPEDSSSVDPTNNTMKLVRINFMMDDSVDHSMDDSGHGPMDDSMEESSIIFIRPKPKIFFVQVREFHECVSCSIDDEPRKHFDQCLQKLSFKNQEVVKSCCNTSFQSDFCSKSSTGKINYVTICKHPEKALKVGYCFWQKIENKDTEDIKEYRECKKQILDNYCTVKSFKDIDPAMEDVQERV